MTLKKLLESTLPKTPKLIKSTSFSIPPQHTHGQISKIDGQ
jgi:hypothetical protein